MRKLLVLPKGVHISHNKFSTCPQCKQTGLRKKGQGLAFCNLCRTTFRIRADKKQLKSLPDGFTVKNHRYMECPKCEKFKLKKWNRKIAVCFNCGGVWRI